MTSGDFHRERVIRRVSRPEPDFSRPCATCTDGDHERCDDWGCGCLVEHPGDDRVMVNFKAIKRALHPDREAWVRGGWK